MLRQISNNSNQTKFLNNKSKTLLILFITATVFVLNDFIVKYKETYYVLFIKLKDKQTQ